MMFLRRRKKRRVQVPRVNVDEVIISTAKTIGSAIGVASGAVEIGKRSANQAKKVDGAELKRAMREKRAAAKEIAKQAESTKEAALNKAVETRKMAAKRADEAKKQATVRALDAKKKAESKVDDLGVTAARKIASKRRRGILSLIRR